MVMTVRAAAASGAVINPTSWNLSLTSTNGGQASTAPPRPLEKRYLPRCR